MGLGRSLPRWLSAVRGGASVAAASTAEKKAGGKKKKAKAAAQKAEAPAAKAAAAPPAAAAGEEEEAGVDAAPSGRTRTHKFIVDEAVNDDHSMVALSKETMRKLDLYQVCGCMYMT